MGNIILISEDELYHFNPYHDKLGRFANRVGSAATRVIKSTNTYGIIDSARKLANGNLTEEQKRAEHDRLIKNAVGLGQTAIRAAFAGSLGGVVLLGSMATKTVTFHGESLGRVADIGHSNVEKFLNEKAISGQWV